MAQNPDLHGVLERTGWVLMESLLADRYDFVFTRQCMVDLYSAPGELCSKTLIHDGFSVAVHSSHPCAERDSIDDLSCLNGSKLLMVDKHISGNIYESIFKFFLPTLGFCNTVPDYVVHNMDELLGQVAAGRGISIIPFYSTIGLSYKGVKLLRIEGLGGCDADVSLVWNPNKMTQIKQEYLDFIMEQFPEPLDP